MNKKHNRVAGDIKPPHHPAYGSTQGGSLVIGIMELDPLFCCMDLV